MIVAPVFDGDNNETVMKIQHKSYGENLSSMVFNAQRIYKNALELLQINNAPLLYLLDFESFDHRIFQLHHDIIAAYFRFQFNQQLQQTLFENEEEYKHRVEEQWKNFWKNENDDLNKNNHWVRYVINAIIIGNTEKGYKAEKNLTVILKKRYYDFQECKWFDDNYKNDIKTN